jgi:hypothetical protein
MDNLGLVVIVSPKFKPYRGVPGYIDWRSHGRFSKFIKAGVFHGNDGEWLLLGRPLVQVGLVVCGGCELPENASEKDTLGHLKSWQRTNEHVWKNLAMQRFHWGLSEDWIPFVEMWKTLFHNEQYVDVNTLRDMERSYAVPTQNAP